MGLRRDKEPGQPRSGAGMQPMVQTVGWRREAIANLREATELYLEEFPLVNHGRPLVTVFDARFA